MKKKLMVMIALWACLCMSMTACGGQQESSDGADQADETAVTEAAPVDESAWKAAYLEALEADEEVIQQYQINEERGLVALSDLNSDGTPELLYFAFDDATTFPALKIYTYKDGIAQRVSYQKHVACTEYSDLPVDALYDFQIQGGTDYQVFMKSDGTLVMYNLLYGADSSPGMASCYRMSADGQLEEVSRFGFVDETMNSMLEQPEGLTTHFWKDGEEISEDEYLALCDEATSGISELLFRQNRTTAGYNHDAGLWDATASMSEKAMPYEQAVSELSE